MFAALLSISHRPTLVEFILSRSINLYPVWQEGGLWAVSLSQYLRTKGSVRTPVRPVLGHMSHKEFFLRSCPTSEQLPLNPDNDVCSC